MMKMHETVKYLAMLMLLTGMVLLGSPSVLADAPRGSNGADEGVQRPTALYLTWQQDPTTTMTIQWHTEGPDEEVILEYGPVDGDTLDQVEGDSHPMVYSDRHIHTVELTGLEPDSEYRFRLYREERGQSSRFYSFRTMPATADERPIIFAAGGDTRQRQSWMEQTNREAMKFDLDFIVWGGDYAYADGREDRVHLWYEWFDAYKNTLVTDEGRVVPVLLAIGNHEVVGGYYWNRDDVDRDNYTPTDEYREKLAPYFFNLFAYPGQPGYGTMDFGDYMSIILLDSDHVNLVAGKQTEWLKEQLEQRTHVPHVFPVYHFAAYPSARPTHFGVARLIREHWHPVFDQHDNIRVAFEHHDHTYKRTVPIRHGKEDEDGIVYIGDGAWGVRLREIHDVDETWYLERAEAIRHFILVTIEGESQEYQMYDADGNLIDQYVPRPLAR
ncbi:fibronectin type III domain-containing protein [Phycisphaerales bacterium AB-hyl4]|uniref:Fibronectin type III domain-containing protein n=1 Tax=Natronomicrosphaera hydrolytica TaxID=3242702 RepID=A0ABV4U3T4_9BACT